MVLETFAPSKDLSAFVKCYMIADCNQSTLVNSMLPDTSLVLGFRYRGTTTYLSEREHRLPFAVVAGLRKDIQLMRDEAGTANLLVIFKVGGASPYFREPLHSMFGNVIDLQEFSNFRNLNEIEDKLCAATSNPQRIRIVEQFLTSRLQGEKYDPVVDNAIRLIKARRGTMSIKELLVRIPLSIDAFEKRFRRLTGATPKQFSYIVRMNSIIEQMSGTKSLAEIALDAGYYDQAHFTKDFKTFTGQTPREFLQSPLP